MYRKIFVVYLFSVGIIFPNESDYNKITEEYIGEIINLSFSQNNGEYIRSADNEVNVFDHENNRLCISGKSLILEKKLSIRFTNGVSAKYYKSDGAEKAVIEADQIYWNKELNVIVFWGNIKLVIHDNNAVLNSNCLIYDVTKNIFFNNTKTKIVLDKSIINGDGILVRSDLKYCSFLKPFVVLNEMS